MFQHDDLVDTLFCRLDCGLHWNDNELRRSVETHDLALQRPYSSENPVDI